jgi:hypothetical protein
MLLLPWCFSEACIYLWTFHEGENPGLHLQYRLTLYQPGWTLDFTSTNCSRIANLYLLLHKPYPVHRYLMSRLSLQVFYLWRHVLSTATPFILWWSNLETLFAPLHRSSPFIGRAALSSNSNRTRSVYSRKNPKSSRYCELSVIQIQIPCSCQVKKNATTLGLKLKIS